MHGGHLFIVTESIKILNSYFFGGNASRGGALNIIFLGISRFELIDS